MLEGLIGLSDEQMDTIVRATAPLTQRERALFLVDMAQALRGQEIDDEAVVRACVVARRRSEREADCAQQARCWRQRPAAGGKFDGLLG